MNYDQHPPPTSYQHMGPSPSSYAPPPPQHISHPPPTQHLQQLPPMSYPAQAPPDMANNGIPPQQSPAESAQNPLEPVMKKDEQGRLYRLDVVQEPKRARMCGFGDKDRRPITPPPCVRLVIIDSITGKEVDCNEIDHSMYVLNVDLWSEDACREVNLVRHSTSTPSISSTVPCSYQSLSESTPAYAPILPSHATHRDPGYGQQPIYGQQQAMVPVYQGGGYPAPYAVQQNNYGPPQQYFPNFDNMPAQAGMPYGRADYGNPLARMSMGGGQPQGMFTRNLIGSLAASAFRLSDTDDRIGIWFILQDLSVRTEGNFRLRFSFVNVGHPSTAPNGAPANQNSIVNTGKAPILASNFSEVFTVYSAKKFPGVCESTPLSKCFAAQGIKIPIRKEGATGGKGADDDDGDF